MSRSVRRLLAVGAIAASLPLSLMAATAASAAVPRAAPVATHGAVRAAVPFFPHQGTFRIVNHNAPSRCIGISNTWAGLWDCTFNPDQTWHWGNTNSSGYTQLINGNNRCLGVDGGSTRAGARIRAWPCNGNDDQYWAALNAPVNPYCYLLNSKSGDVIGVLNGSTSNGAELIQWPANRNGDQYWAAG